MRRLYKFKFFPICFLSALFFVSQLASAAEQERRLKDENLNQYASVFNLNIQNPVELILDNATSFNQKLRLVREAKQSLDLMYYIYSNDESSSYFSQELIKAAHRGVKIRVLLDYITNYKLLDTLVAIQTEAAKNPNGGSIEFRFYGRPTPNIIRDVIYMTTACEDNLSHEDCVRQKTQAGNKFINAEEIQNAGVMQKDLLLAKARNINSGLSGVFFSGLYGKSGNTLKFILHALGYDKKIAAAKNATHLNPEDRDNAKDLIKLYMKSKKGDLAASLKLNIATLFMGNELDPVLDLLTEILPIELGGLDHNRINDWGHFTDYLHHKLLIADNGSNYELILGGRNIENSYHMQKNPSGKYTFFDTDALASVDNSSGRKIINTYNKIWNFNELTATVNDVFAHAPNDTMAVLSNCKVLDAACVSQIPRTVEATIASRTLRYQAAIQNMNNKADLYLSPEYSAYNQPKIRPALKVDKKVDSNSRVSYIENLPFDKNQSFPVRKYGSRADSEETSGKYIHKIWANALLDTCGPEKGLQTIYLHSAYVVFPTPILAAIAEMVKTSSPANTFNSFNYAKTDCSNVTIKILTNSVETTDLSVINVFARVQMHALFRSLANIKLDNAYQDMNLTAKAAKIEYYEYAVKAGEKSDSLHTKVSIIGNNAIIGSANADVRSYMMDSNNGFYIENAPNFTKQYGKFIEAQLQNPAITQRLDLGWRVGANNSDKSYISTEIDFLIKKIKYLLRDRSWAKEKYFTSLERIFDNVYLDDIVQYTLDSATTYTNISEHELDVLQAAHSEAEGPFSPSRFDIRKLYEDSRRKKSEIDTLLMYF